MPIHPSPSASSRRPRFQATNSRVLQTTKHTAPATTRGSSGDVTSVRSTRGSDRKSTRLNSSHGYISYAVFCLKKKKKQNHHATLTLPSNNTFVHGDSC